MQSGKRTQQQCLQLRSRKNYNNNNHQVNHSNKKKFKQNIKVKIEIKKGKSSRQKLKHNQYFTECKSKKAAAKRIKNHQNKRKRLH